VSAHPRRGRPRLVDPDLAARVPGLRPVAATAVALAVLSAAAIIVQAVALASVVDRSLLHHAPLRAVTPGLIVLGLAILARAALHGAGDLSALRAADRVVATLRRQLLEHALALGPGWLGGERPGELSLTATRGLRSLHTYYARYLPQAAAAAVLPVILLVWVATQDWLAFAVVIVLVLAVPVTMIAFGREATRRSERQWRRLSSLSGRVLQLVEGLPTLRAFGRAPQGRREVEAATEGVRSATMRTLRVAFLSALAMDMIAGFGVGFVAMVLGLRLLWASSICRPPWPSSSWRPRSSSRCAAPGPSSTPAPKGRPRRRASSRCWQHPSHRRRKPTSPWRGLPAGTLPGAGP
jgi:ATP-binding cassette subfamily C protein CydCD